MQAAPRTVFSCPVCHAAFLDVDAAAAATDKAVDKAPWRCPNKHSFDVAKDGTVHLLPAGHGMAGIVGDSAVMLAARRRFFDAGHYRPLSDAIARATALHVRAGGLVTDLGCGEGSHLGVVLDAIEARHGGKDGAFAVGVDLAKDAIKLAARKERRARFVTGDTRSRIPLLDGTVDAAVVAFAPRKAPELARVIRPGGVVVVAIPLPGHLAELVATWGGIGLADDKRDRLVKDLEGDFAVGDEHVVEHTLHLPGTATADLLLMTPHARHLGDDTLERARQTASFSTTLRALILTMTRR
jgi:23S rRNA (guanine745-N1)-methyltransferase